MSNPTRNSKPGHPRGYILVETIVAMGLLSISMMVIQGAIRQAIITRGQAEDYTTARFLMEQVVAKIELQPQMQKGSARGPFEGEHGRFSYEWELTKVEVPRPAFPDDMPPAERKQLELMFKGYMGKLRVVIRWARAGQEFEAAGETLLAPEKLWIPPRERAGSAPGRGF